MTNVKRYYVSYHNNGSPISMRLTVKAPDFKTAMQRMQDELTGLFEVKAFTEHIDITIQMYPGEITRDYVYQVEEGG